MSHEFPEETLVTYTVPVSQIAAYGNPLTEDPWLSGVTEAQIRAAWAGKNYHAEPLPDGEQDPIKHAKRIAYLADHGWTDEIVVSVGIPSFGLPMPPWPVLDGNHRLAAALLRGDEDILITPDGDLGVAEELFGS